MMALRAMLAGVGLGAAGLAALSAATADGHAQGLVPDLVRPAQLASGQGWTKPGTCLAVGQAGGPSTVVGCREEHIFELASAVDLAAYPGSEFGSAAPYPDPARLVALREELCAAEVNAYLGGKFDAHGRFTVGLLLPSLSAWAQGDRLAHCGLELSGSRGKLLGFTRKVAEQDQSTTYDTGVCVGAENNMPADPADCHQPHAFEVIGHVDLGSQFPGRTGMNPPDEKEQNDKLKGICGKLAEDYVGNPDRLRETTLDVNWTVLKPQSWLAGSRTVVCFLAKHHDQGFSVIEGTAKGDVLVNGAKPVPPPKPTRSTLAPVTGPPRPPE